MQYTNGGDQKSSMKISTIYVYRLMKWFGLKCSESYSDQKASDEGQRAQWSKGCE